MMQRDRTDREELLLDWHLDQLAGEDRSWVEAELDRDEAFRRCSEQLGRNLQPLDHWQTSVPPHLADSTLRYVKRAAEAEVLSMESAGGTGSWWAPAVRGRDLIAVAACIILLFGVAVPGLSFVRGRAQQAQCADNLGAIFRGVSTYQEMFAGSLPFAGRPAPAAWLPNGSSEAPFRSNSRHIFRLVRHGCGPKPDDFICPSDPQARPMEAEGLADHDDFASLANVSYDTLNLSGSRPNVRPTTRLIYVSDPNPLFLGARFHDGVDPDRTNSPAHGGRGQNALTTTGEAIFLRTPFYGPNNDNVWLAGTIRVYKGTECPVSEDDVQLVPGCPDGENGSGGVKPTH